MRCITYRDGYKYQLEATYRIQIGLIPPTAIVTEYLQLDAEGNLTIKEGYAWDGPSGPTIDSNSFMRGSLIHDALYQLMRDRWLDHEEYRELADRILQDICKEDGMWAFRAWYVYHAVRMFADPSADPADKKPSRQSPDGCTN